MAGRKKKAAEPALLLVGEISSRDTWVSHLYIYIDDDVMQRIYRIRNALELLKAADNSIHDISLEWPKPILPYGSGSSIAPGLYAWDSSKPLPDGDVMRLDYARACISKYGVSFAVRPKHHDEDLSYQIYFSQETDTVWSKLVRTFPSRAGGDL